MLLPPLAGMFPHSFVLTLAAILRKKTQARYKPASRRKITVGTAGFDYAWEKPSCLCQVLLVKAMVILAVFRSPLILALYGVFERLT